MKYSNNEVLSFVSLPDHSWRSQQFDFILRVFVFHLNHSLTHSKLIFQKIVFEGVKGASYTGDIAIDDVKIMNGSCPSPGDCSFDDGMCTWTNARTGDTFDWIVGGGRTPSFLTGPSKDHTTGSGRFFYFICFFVIGIVHPFSYLKN